MDELIVEIVGNRSVGKTALLLRLEKFLESEGIAYYLGDAYTREEAKQMKTNLKNNQVDVYAIKALVSLHEVCVRLGPEISVASEVRRQEDGRCIYLTGRISGNRCRDCRVNRCSVRDRRFPLKEL